MQIIAARSSGDIDVQFLDEYKYIKHNTTYINFIRGQIKNPYDKTVFGVGYLGVGDYVAYEDKGKKSTHVYSVWRAILIRCYDEKRKDVYPAYYDKCTVCDEWFNFQNFAKWYDQNKYKVNERLHTDKDIKIPGNTLYSPETCILVPQRINMLFANKPNNRGLPNGICLNGKGYNAKYNSKSLGTYETLDIAFSHYASEKEKTIKKIANDYIDIIPKEVYNTVINYKVKKEYDINYKAS